MGGTEKDRDNRNRKFIAELIVLINKYGLMGELTKQIAETKKATRIPADFAPSLRCIEWAKQKYQAVNLTLETEKFVDYWSGISGQRGTKLDWQATWRNWIRNANEFMTKRGLNDEEGKRDSLSTWLDDAE